MSADNPSKTKIKYSPSGLKLSKAEYAKFENAVSTDYYNKNKTHKGLQYQSCVTDKTHTLYIYEDGGFEHLSPVARIDYANERVANAFVEVLNDGNFDKITEVIDFVLKTLELGRGGYTVYNARTGQRRSARGNGVVFKEQSKSNAGGTDAGGGGLSRNSGGTESKRGDLKFSFGVKGRDGGGASSVYPSWVYDVLEGAELQKLESALMDIRIGNDGRFVRTRNGEYIV